MASGGPSNMRVLAAAAASGEGVGPHLIPEQAS